MSVVRVSPFKPQFTPRRTEVIIVRKTVRSYYWNVLLIIPSAVKVFSIPPAASMANLVRASDNEVGDYAVAAKNNTKNIFDDANTWFERLYIVISSTRIVRD
jgi:uncharacterized protein YybS (DUF2232 family)